MIVKPPWQFYVIRNVCRYYRPIIFREGENLCKEKRPPPPRLRGLIRIGAFALIAALSFNPVHAQTLGANVSGSILFDDAVGVTVPVDFVFSSVTEPYTFSARGKRNTDGTFTIDTIPSGKFLVAVTAPGRLQKVAPVDTTNGDVSNFSVTLAAGDANGDNISDSSDFGMIIASFNTYASIPDSGYEPAADLNYDGSVDSSDFTLLIGYFGQQGDVYAGNLTVTAAASGLKLDWTTNSPGASYNVYRATTPGGNGTLYASNLTQPTFTDASAVSGVAYYYRISAVSQNGETQKSNEATGKKATARELQITNIANGATLSGDTQVSVSFSGFRPNIGMRLQLDGEYIGDSCPEGALNNAGVIYFSLPTDAYSNGQHTFRVVDSSGRSDVRSVNFSNAISNFAYNDTFDVNAAPGDISNVCAISGNIASAQPWTVTIQTQDDTPVAVRTFSGNSSAINVTWDGNDSNGLAVADSNYDVVLQLVGTPPRPPQTHPVNKIDPYLSDALLVLQTDSTIFKKNADVPNSLFGLPLAEQCRAFVLKRLNPYLGVTFTKIDHLEVDPSKPFFFKDKRTGKVGPSDTYKTLARALGHRLSLFYVDSHGDNAPHPFFLLGGVVFDSAPSDHIPGYLVKNMPDLVATANYGNSADPPALVWIDSCNSAGGNVNNTPGQTDDSFAQAFNSGANGYGVFLGWNGSVWAYGSTIPYDFWRRQWWTEVGAGRNFDTALNNTNNKTSNNGLGPYVGDLSPVTRATLLGAGQSGF